VRYRAPRTLDFAFKAVCVLCADPMISRRAFLALGAGSLVTPGPAGAQTPKKTARVGLLSPGDAKTRAWVVEPFRKSLHRHGWVEGDNLVIEYRYGGDDYERLQALAKELGRLKVDVILAASAPAARAAKDATTTTPIVFVTGNDPVRAGLVASFARPGGNMTGQAGLGPELDRKRIELLKAVLPTLSAVTLLANPTNPMTAQRLPEFKATAQALQIAVRMVGASDGKRLDAALHEIGRAGTAGLIVLEDPTLIAHRTRIIDFMAQNRVPTMYTSYGWAEQGGLMEYTPDNHELYSRAATYVNRILRGAKPGDLPVEQPTKFELIINLKTAQALGLTIPPSVLGRADRVIE
jgi:putative ABC transport system substrate-binding protein